MAREPTPEEIDEQISVLQRKREQLLASRFLDAFRARIQPFMQDCIAADTADTFYTKFKTTVLEARALDDAAAREGGRRTV